MKANSLTWTVKRFPSVAIPPAKSTCTIRRFRGKHAIIKSAPGGQHYIIDQKSSNGTYINDRRMQKHLLGARDLIRIGQTTLVYDTGAFQSTGDAREQVKITSNEDSGSKIIDTISAKVTLPAYEEDSQITDSFLEHLEDNIHVIYHTAVATSRYTNIDQLHQKVLQLIFDWVKADRGCILLLDQQTGDVTPAAFRHRDEPADSSETIIVSQSVLDYVKERNEGVLTTDIDADERWASGTSPSKDGVIEAMCVPMQGRMGIVGFVYVDNFVIQSQSKRKKQKHFEQHFSQQQLKMLLAVAHQAALATENATYYRAMTQNGPIGRCRGNVYADRASLAQSFTRLGRGQKPRHDGNRPR